MQSLRTLGPLLAVLVVTGAPALAWACPYCAQNTQDGDAFSWLLGAMIFLPFVVVGLVAYVIKNGGPQGREPHL